MAQPFTVRTNPVFTPGPKVTNVPDATFLTLSGEVLKDPPYVTGVIPLAMPSVSAGNRVVVTGISVVLPLWWSTRNRITGPAVFIATLNDAQGDILDVIESTSEEVPPFDPMNASEARAPIVTSKVYSPPIPIRGTPEASLNITMVAPYRAPTVETFSYEGYINTASSTRRYLPTPSIILRGILYGELEN